jgi:hypothetical protein
VPNEIKRLASVHNGKLNGARFPVENSKVQMGSGSDGFFDMVGDPGATLSKKLIKERAERQVKA